MTGSYFDLSVRYFCMPKIQSFYSYSLYSARIETMADEYLSWSRDVLFAAE